MQIGNQIICEWCNKSFVRKKYSNKFTRFCSEECRDKCWQTKNTNYGRKWYEQHKDRYKKWGRETYERHKEEYRKKAREKYKLRKEKQRKYQQEIKLQALNIISKGRIYCENCGCKDIRVLEINHINGKTEEEKIKRKGGILLYHDIIRNRRKIDDLNILCTICNWAYFIKQKYNIDYKIEVK